MGRQGGTAVFMIIVRKRSGGANLGFELVVGAHFLGRWLAARWRVNDADRGFSRGFSGLEPEFSFGLLGIQIYFYTSTVDVFNYLYLYVVFYLQLA